MDHHILRNYKDVRNMILGYDSKRGIWISKYGESLARKEIIPNKVFVKGGMTFYEDEVFDRIRINMDDVVKRVLDVLFTISKYVIDYKYITDMIVTEWNSKNTTLLDKTNVPYDIYGEIHLYPIDIRENSWREFKSISRQKGLMVRDAFKIATIDFLRNRACILD